MKKIILFSAALFCSNYYAGQSGEYTMHPMKFLERHFVHHGIGYCPPQHNPNTFDLKPLANTYAGQFPFSHIIVKLIPTKYYDCMHYSQAVQTDDFAQFKKYLSEGLPIILFKKAQHSEDNSNILSHAILRSNTIAQFLIKNKIVPLNQKNTTEVIATLLEKNDLALFSLFFQHYTDDIDVNGPIDSDGETILHELMRMPSYLEPKEEEVLLTQLSFLLKAGADPNIPNKQLETPLHLATRYDVTKKRKIIQLLLHYGADTEKTNLNGQTPAHIAFDKGNHSTLKVLLKNEAGIYIVDKIFNESLYSMSLKRHSMLGAECFDNEGNSQLAQCKDLVLNKRHDLPPCLFLKRIGTFPVAQLSWFLYS